MAPGIFTMARGREPVQMEAIFSGSKGRIILAPLGPPILTKQWLNATRMFTRDELPEGSYVVVASGWKIRPEVWATDENGNIKKTSNRPGEKSAGTYAIETLWQDSESAQSAYKYMAFNLSEEQGGYLENMTPEGVANILQIYVPQTTKVAKNEVEDGKKKLTEGRAELEEARKELASGRKEIEDAKAELADGRKQYEDGLAEYEQAKLDLEEGRKKYEEV